MKVTSVLLIIVIGVFSGCASVQKNVHAIQNVRTEGSEKILISAEINKNLSSEYFGMVEFTFENPTEEWIDIESISIDVDDEAIKNSMKITTGNDFIIWSKAINKRNRIEDYNKAIAYAAIVGIASVTASVSNNKNVQNTARAVGMAALSSLTLDEIHKFKQKAEGNDIFPEDHLLSGTFRIPPGLFINSWLLINTSNHAKNKLLSELEMTLKYKNGENDKFSIQLYPSGKTRIPSYRWQTEILERMKQEERDRKREQKAHN